MAGVRDDHMGEDRGRPLVAAVDIGATKTLVAVIHAGLARWPVDLAVRRLPTDADPHALAVRIAAAISELARGVPVAAVGVAAPGPLDATAGIVRHSPNLGWRDVPLAAILGAAVGAPVALDDDANLGALGEARFGAGTGADPLAYLTLSTGIGSGIVIGGRVVRGAHGGAGEVGHLAFRPDGPPCSCGGRGHVEAYAGGAGLTARAREAWLEAGWGENGSGDGRPPEDASDVFRLAQAGHPLASRLVEDAAEAVGAALAALVATIDPARIVVGGSLGIGQPAFIRRAVAFGSARALPGTDVGSLVVPATLGSSSVLAGAAILAARSLGA